MNDKFGTLTRRPVHPASPVLLTKNGPLGIIHSTSLSSIKKLKKHHAHLKFESRSKLFQLCFRRSLALPDITVWNSNNPERIFEGNQQPGGSIGLSPLNSNQTNDLHVSIAASLHQGFPWLRPVQVKFTTFRVLTAMLLLKSPTSDRLADGATYINRNWPRIPPQSRFVKISTFTFISHSSFWYSNTCRAVRLLSPCFKTRRWILCIANIIEHCDLNWSFQILKTRNE